jgi:hypothetical protein
MGFAPFRDANNITSIEHSNHQKRGEIADAALNEFNKFIGTILDASEMELKTLCRDKNIRLHGKPAMKHKYAFALLENYARE